MFLLSINWPPPVYDMPTYTPYDASTLALVFEILKNSLKSMTNTGLLILGACLAAGAVFSIVGGFVCRALALEDGVRRNMFRREVSNLDMKRNAGSIAINREMNMHVNFLARRLYHFLHREEEIEEGIYKRELAHEIDQRIKEKHPEWAVERRMDSAEAERQYREQTRQQRLEDFIRRTKEKDEFEAALRQQNRDRAAQRIVQRRLDTLEANEILRSEHGEKLVHDAVERSWVNDEAQAAFRVQNPAGAVRRSVQNRLDSMEADKVLRTEHRKELVNNRAGNMMVNRAAKIRYQEMLKEEHQAEAAAQLKASMRAQEAVVNPVTGEVTHKPRRRKKK
jgi:hypothetical protein